MSEGHTSGAEARKKIFIIHGKGVVKGIGMEGGGDLDTVGSNAFYGAWIRGLFASQGKTPVYGSDYEHDFVNYSEGLSHLIRHRGCDIYLPDFPIDALAPRMTFTTLISREIAILRNDIAFLAQDARSRALNSADSMSEEAKELYNEISKKLLTLRKAENPSVLAATLALTRNVYDELLGGGEQKEGASSALDLLKGPVFQTQMENTVYVLDRVEDFLDSESALEAVGAAQEAAMETALKALRRALFMTRNATNMHTLALEAMNIPELLATLKPWVKEGGQRLAELLEDMEGALDSVWKAAGIDRSKLISGQDSGAPVQNGPQKGSAGARFMVHLCEDSSGKPVHTIPVTFRLDLAQGWKARIITVNSGSGKSGAEAFGPEASGQTQLEEPTGMDGVACLEILPPSGGSADQPPNPEKAMVSATFDGITWLSWPLGSSMEEAAETSAGTEAGTEAGTAAETERKLSEELTGPEVAADETEEAPESDRVTSNAVTLIERDIRFLTANDVRIVRMDDHHPWTPAIHSMLQGLEKEGLIGTMRIHAYERGREMEKDESLCGADLIHQAMIEGQKWDNEGLVELKRLAHVQDLHLMEDKLAIDLSKLIGSGFSKVEMARRLAEVADFQEMTDIMARAGWAERVAGYEGGLALVLPRLFRSMARVTLKDEEGNLTRIIMILAPFTDRKIGEAKINVASAINFLKDKVEMDFLFYCYGSTMMTTRKTGEGHSPIDLSLLSQHAGTKSDGGHAEAATCKPGSNPAFPGHLFAKLADNNFLEYANYIGSLTADRFGLQLEMVEDVIPPFHEDGMEPVAERIVQNLFLIRGTAASRDLSLGVVFAPRASKKDNEFQPTMNSAVKNLAKAGLDYLLYCRSGSISIRPMSALARQVKLDFSALSRVIGDDPDRVSPFSGCLMPHSGPLADPAFRFHTAENFPGYLRHLADALDESGVLKVKRVEPAVISENLLNSSAVVQMLERCAKKAAVIHVIEKPRGDSWKSDLKGLAKAASGLGALMPADMRERFNAWLYSLDSSRRASILVVPFSPRGGAGFEAAIPLIASGLSSEFPIQAVILFPGVDYMSIARTDPADRVVKAASLCDLIDGAQHSGKDWGVGLCFPSRSKVLPQNLRQVNDANFHLCLDWMARALEASGNVSVVSVSRARTS